MELVHKLVDDGIDRYANKVSIILGRKEYHRNKGIVRCTL